MGYSHEAANSRSDCRVVHDSLDLSLQQFPLRRSVWQGSQLVKIIVHTHTNLVASEHMHGKYAFGTTKNC